MLPTNLLIIFLTGLTTGGLTCLALQGGLLASVITSSKQKSSSGIRDLRSEISIISFLTAKLFIHTILGFLLGFLGATISLSPVTRGWLQIAIGVYLFGIAGNLLDLHPFFRYFVITPPKFLSRLAKNESKSSSIFAPAILGLMTVFIPCATTQAMEVIAIGTGNPWYAASIMFAFVLGTTPTFLLFGFLLEKGSVSFKKYFPSVAGTAMFIMSIFSINTGIAVMGSPYTIQNFWQVATPSLRISTNSGAEAFSNQQGNTQEITISVTNSGYTPANITLKKGVLTKLKLITNNVQSCSRAFTIPGLNLQKILPETGETIIEFTPESEGPLAFSCSMGMYTGKFNIIN